MWLTIKKTSLFEDLVMMIVITFVLYSTCGSHERDPDDKYMSRYEGLCMTPLYMSVPIAILTVLIFRHKK